MTAGLTGFVLYCRMLSPASLESQAQSVRERLSTVAIVVTSSDRLGEFGDLAGAVSDARGRVFILDPTVPRIVVTDSSLRLLGYFGRRGAGPGEFREAAEIAVLPGGRVAVLDRALRRVTILSVRAGGRTLVPERSILTQIPSESMCMLADGAILVYGFSRGNRLHILSSTGQSLRSFAPAEARLSPTAQYLVAMGKIACDTMQDEVLVSSAFLPLVEAFRISTGDRLWADTLRPYRTMVISDQGSTVRVTSGRAGASVVSSLFSLGDFRVFQAVFSARRDDAPIDTVLTYVYSRRAKAWLPPAYDTPLLYHTRGTTALSVLDDGDRQRISLNRVQVLQRTGAVKEK